MKQTTAAKTLSPHAEAAKQAAKRDSSDKARREFFVAAMNMSWQLAIVVLVPIIGGFKIDEKLDTLPAFTIAGFFIAMAGMGYIMWRQLQLFTPPAPSSAKGPRP